MSACEARQYGDQMQCGRCGLAWDVVDAERPACAPRIDKRAIPSRAVTVATRRLELSFEEPPPRSPEFEATMRAPVYLFVDAGPTPYGCHNQPRPVAGAVTHVAQDGWHGGADSLFRSLKLVEIRHVMSTACAYDKRAEDRRCAGCQSAESSAVSRVSGAAPGTAGV